MAMNFDKAVVRVEDGKERTFNAAEFLAVPLGERIQWMTQAKVKFYRNGQQISPLEAVRGTPAP